MGSGIHRRAVYMAAALMAVAFFGQYATGAEPQTGVVAYEIPAGTNGNQNFGGPLGMDFDVNLDIVVTRLGVFDSGSDGLNLPLNARIYDRDLIEELVALDFTPEDAGELIGGSRFKDLDTPLELPAGFHGTIVGSGYGNAELNGNQGGVNLGLSTNDGGCSITFVGGGRFGDPASPLAFPGTADGGPQNRYAAGTFVFDATEALTPTGAIAYSAPDATLGLQTDFGGNLGHDFNVNTPILVTRLGVFDSGDDGLQAPLTARIFLRPSEVAVATVEFTPEDPGDLEQGHRFKALDTPLALPAGFRGTSAASGFGPLDPNGNGDLGQTADNGNCAISFTGAGRFGSDPVAYPGSRDGGPFNRYLGPSFEFEVDPNPPVPPPEPPGNLTATAGDQKVDLVWEAPTGTTPAALYRVFRAPSAAGPFTQIAEIPGTTFTDTGLTNEVDVCYYVLSVAADSRVSFESLHRCTTPVGPLPEGRFISYVIEGGTAGNQEHGGSLGMDFDVEADIRILRFGVFDDNSDGLTRTITAKLFNRDTQEEILFVDFTPEDPGILIGGSRFKVLDDPIDLDAGFHGTMSASGYGAGERNGNQGVGPIAGMTTDSGECRISFLGGGRFNGDAAFPLSVDGGPVNRYASGTFDFEGRGAPFSKVPGIPTLSSTSGDGSVELSFQPVAATPCILAATSFKVFRSFNGSAFSEIAQPTGLGYVDSGLAPGDYCYKIRAVADGGVESGDSSVVCDTPGRFIAYKVPSGTVGTVTDGLIVGMDFNVNLDIKVHRLGVFDSSGDGLVTPITVRIYDVDQAAEVVSLEFTPEDPGDLLAGSRFKDLETPIDLGAGFHGSIVAEGYSLEEPYGAGGPWTTDQGPCSISFVGRNRQGFDPAILPAPLNIPRPDHFAAGTFQFEAMEVATPHPAIAYVIPEGQLGNQAHTGPLGMDFDVNVGIQVTRLGVFDSGSDGLVNPILAILFDRSTQTELARLDFTPEDPGDLEGGSRFKELDPPINLPAGFKGTMSATGYGALEMNGNHGVAGGDTLGNTTDDGGCAIQFLGGGRFGDIAGGPAAFPTLVDGGPPHRYMAGTFDFTPSIGPPLERFRRGDVDGNGVLDVTDPVLLLSNLFLGSGELNCLDAADTDDSGVLDITDAVNNLGYQFLGAGPPADPGPTNCGVDPTQDALDCKSPCP